MHRFVQKKTKIYNQEHIELGRIQCFIHILDCGEIKQHQLDSDNILLKSLVLWSHHHRFLVSVYSLYVSLCVHDRFPASDNEVYLI